MDALNPEEPNAELNTELILPKPAPIQPVMVQVDQAMMMGIVHQRNHYHEHVCRVMAALPILIAELPKIQWLSLIGSLGFDVTSIINPFTKKKKKENGVSLEQVQMIYAKIINEHPHLQTPITHLVNFWITYQHINGPTDGRTTE